MVVPVTEPTQLSVDVGGVTVTLHSPVAFGKLATSATGAVVSSTITVCVCVLVLPLPSS